VDLEDPRTFDLFLEVYGSLPRAGPGSTADTLRALSLVPTADLRSVLDLGCGPGAQTVALAEALPEASILALDLVPSMVAEVRRRIAEAGLAPRVRAEIGDLTAPGLANASWDLIWCEGAIYFAGVEAALRTWKPLLAAGGSVSFTEPLWIHPSPPHELQAWWREQYPAITDEEGIETAIDAAGYDLVAFFVLPPESWWDAYYRPMENRIPEFAAAHPDDEIATEIVAEATEEIEVFRANSKYYSYGFFVVQPK
jgi:SAM-dependent methyltransferase